MQNLHDKYIWHPIVRGPYSELDEQKDFVNILALDLNFASAQDLVAGFAF